MSVKLLTEQCLELLSFKGGCTGLSEATFVKMSHCWKSRVTADIYFLHKTLLEYSNVVWDNYSQYESTELRKIQKEAARIVLGAIKLTSLDSLFKETGLENLAQRGKKSKRVLFYKMLNGITPEYISSLASLLLVVQLNTSCVMSQIFKPFLLNHSNIIIPFYVQLREDYQRTKIHLLY